MDGLWVVRIMTCFCRLCGVAGFVYFAGLVWGWFMLIGFVVCCLFVGFVCFVLLFVYCCYCLVLVVIWFSVDADDCLRVLVKLVAVVGLFVRCFKGWVASSCG